MFNRHVTKTDRRNNYRANRRKDRRQFSRTADMTERINTSDAGRPMRGGIRL